jgi:hypothetical protein
VQLGRAAECGGLVIWRSGDLVIWLSGDLAIWLSGYLAIWLSGDLAIWRSGDLAIWRSGYLAIGDLAIWISGDLAIWLSGDLVIWRLAIRLSGYLAICSWTVQNCDCCLLVTLPCVTERVTRCFFLAAIVTGPFPSCEVFATNVMHCGIRQRPGSDADTIPRRL